MRRRSDQAIVNPESTLSGSQEMGRPSGRGPGTPAWSSVGTEGTEGRKRDPYEADEGTWCRSLGTGGTSPLQNTLGTLRGPHPEPRLPSLIPGPSADFRAGRRRPGSSHRRHLASPLSSRTGHPQVLGTRQLSDQSTPAVRAHTPIEREGIAPGNGWPRRAARRVPTSGETDLFNWKPTAIRPASRHRRNCHGH